MDPLNAAWLFENLTYLVIVLIFAVPTLEWALRKYLPRQYFRSGIPLYGRTLSIFRTPPKDIVDLVLKQPAENSLFVDILVLGEFEYALFPTRFRTVRGKRRDAYRSMTHGLVSYSVHQSSLALRIFLNWSALSFYLFWFASIYFIPDGLMKMLFIGLALVGLYQSLSSEFKEYLSLWSSFTRLTG